MTAMNCTTQMVMVHYAEHGPKAFQCGDYRATFEQIGTTEGDYGSIQYRVMLRHVRKPGCESTMYLSDGNGYDISPAQAYQSDLAVRLPMVDVLGCGDVRYGK